VFGVWCLGFGVQGLGFGVWGLKFWFGFGDGGLGVGVQGSKVWELGVRDYGMGSGAHRQVAFVGAWA
jgi:hypothetical protein